jgi:hypothetical protein
MSACHLFGCLGLVCAISGTACVSNSVAVPAATPVPPSSTKSETLEQGESRDLARTWGWILVGGMGGTAGAIAVGTSVLMLVDKNTRDRDCNAAKICSPSGLDANSQLASLAGVNAGAWVVAAAGLGIGTYLLLANPADRASGTQLGLVPNRAGASLSLRTAF